MTSKFREKKTCLIPTFSIVRVVRACETRARLCQKQNITFLFTLNVLLHSALKIQHGTRNNFIS